MIERSENALFHSAPPWTWLHALHQVTGLIARRGTRLTLEDRPEMIAHLKRVLEEIEDDRYWNHFSKINRRQS
jgi:hypothetical protein